jgi:predicted aldo/keto reductase-like oxidoreductase
MKTRGMNRRDALLGLMAIGASSSSGQPAGKAAGNSDSPQMRVLGRTGEKVSSIGLGGSHIGKPDVTDADAVRFIRAFLDRGLNFLDNSWDYNDGRSEIRMGNALRDGYRRKAFLMTKFDGRTKDSATRQIDESLKRLQTDHVDLLQCHEVIRFDDPDRFFAPDGAAEALLAAKKAGKTRYIGFTGHKDPHIHLYMLESAKKYNFTFDTIQMPINVMDTYFRSFGKLVLPEAQRLGMGILAMKSLGSGAILKSGMVSPIECLRYTLSQPVSVVITGIDKQSVLDQALHLAGSFQPLSKVETAELLSKAGPAAVRGEYELFKTTSHFDTTAQHPEWLGPEPARIKELGGN